MASEQSGTLTSQQCSVVTSQHGSSLTSQGTTPGSNVAHVRPIQIQPSNEPDPEMADTNDSVVKDPCSAFENIINIAPIEEDCQYYKTVTVNINGVKKDVKVPLARTGSDNKQDHLEQSNPDSLQDPSPPSNVSRESPVNINTLPTVTNQTAHSVDNGTTQIKTVYTSNMINAATGGSVVVSKNSTAKHILPQLLGLDSVESSARSVVVTSHSAMNSGSANLNLTKGHLVKPKPKGLTFHKANNQMYMIQTAPNQTKPQSNSQMLKAVVGNATSSIPGFLGSDGKFYVQLDPANLSKGITATVPQQGSSKVAVAQVAAQMGPNKDVPPTQATTTPKPSCSWSYLTLKEGQAVPTSKTSTQVMVPSTTNAVSTESSKSMSSNSESDPSGIRIESTFSLSAGAPAPKQVVNRVKAQKTNQPISSSAGFTYILAKNKSPTNTTPNVSAMNIATNPILNPRVTTKVHSAVGSKVAMRVIQAPNQAVVQTQVVTTNPSALPLFSSPRMTISAQRPSPVATTQLTTNKLQTPTVVSGGRAPYIAAPTRKKFLGVIDISDDESEQPEPVANKTAINKSNTKACKNIDRSGVGSDQPHVTPPNQLESLIRDIACGKYVLVSNKSLPTNAPVAQPKPPKSNQTPSLLHPRNTARKSFGRFSRRSSSEEAPSNKSDDLLVKIKAAHPELREVRIHVEKLDINTKGKRTFNVHKLNAYLTNRRRVKQQRIVKQQRAMNAIKSRGKSKREKKKKDEMPIKVEVEEEPPEEIVKDAGVKDEPDILDVATGNDPVLMPEVVVRPRKRASRSADKSVSKSEASTGKQKRRKSDPKPSPSVTVSSGNTMVQSPTEQQKAKFLLIKTSNANYLMPVQPGVSPMAVAQQISSKTAANVTVVSSASITPVPSPAIYQSNVQQPKTLKTMDSVQKPMATPSFMPKITIKTESGVAPSEAERPASLQATPLLQSLMQEATRAEQAGGASSVSMPVVAVSADTIPSGRDNSAAGSRLIASTSVISPSVSGRSLLLPRTTTSTTSNSSSVIETQILATRSDEINNIGSAFHKTPETAVSESTDDSSVNVTPKDNPSDRIKRLREMLKKQEAAVELTREQREKTRKFMETMDD